MEMIFQEKIFLHNKNHFQTQFFITWKLIFSVLLLNTKINFLPNENFFQTQKLISLVISKNKNYFENGNKFLCYINLLLYIIFIVIYNIVIYCYILAEMKNICRRKWNFFKPTNHFCLSCIFYLKIKIIFHFENYYPQ